MRKLLILAAVAMLAGCKAKASPESSLVLSVNGQEVHASDNSDSRWIVPPEPWTESSQAALNMANTVVPVLDIVYRQSCPDSSGQLIYKKFPARRHGSAQCIGAFEYDLFVRCYESKWSPPFQRVSTLYERAVKDVALPDAYLCFDEKEIEIPYANNKLAKHTIGDWFIYQQSEQSQKSWDAEREFLAGGTTTELPSRGRKETKP